jgi:hypothetical protein
MEVKVPSQRLYDHLYSSHDFVEAVQRNGDGSLSTDVLVNSGERALLQSEGVQFETDAATERRVDERDAAEAREERAHVLAESAGRSPSAIPPPGEVTIQRAYTFTNYAGRFLYVEAHSNKADRLAPNGVDASPVMALSYAGADGVFGAASNMPIFRDNQTGDSSYNNVYMYHRHLVRVTDVEPRTVRVASSAGGVDEAPVNEWVGTTRPPHAQGYLTGSSRGTWTRRRSPAASKRWRPSSRTSPRPSTCRTSRTATAARRRRSWACRSARPTPARPATSAPPPRTRP